MTEICGMVPETLYCCCVAAGLLVWLLISWFVSFKWTQYDYEFIFYISLVVFGIFSFVAFIPYLCDTEFTREQTEIQPISVCSDDKFLAVLYTRVDGVNDTFSSERAIIISSVKAGSKVTVICTITRNGYKQIKHHAYQIKLQDLEKKE